MQCFWTTPRRGESLKFAAVMQAREARYYVTWDRGKPNNSTVRNSARGYCLPVGNNNNNPLRRRGCGMTPKPAVQRTTSSRTHAASWVAGRDAGGQVESLNTRLLNRRAAISSPFCPPPTLQTGLHHQARQDHKQQQKTPLHSTHASRCDNGVKFPRYHKTQSQWNASPVQAPTDPDRETPQDKNAQ